MINSVIIHTGVMEKKQGIAAHLKIQALTVMLVAHFTLKSN